VVENRPGGASNIGARACAEASPDGYTICIMPGEPLGYNQFLYKKLAFDPAKDFEPIVNLFFNTQALVVNAALKVKTVEELVALSKAKAGTLSYTAPSLPLAPYLEKLKRNRGADWVAIPFRGGDTTNAVLLAPAGTPKAVINKIREDVVRIGNEPAFRKETIHRSRAGTDLEQPEEFARFLVEDRAVPGHVVKEAGLTPQ
jgi:tripartite-type tricarboxylate transporter receptor subunit TctC